MTQFRAWSLLLLYAIKAASLVLSNTPSSNAITQGIPQLIEPANLIPPQNHTAPLPWGQYRNIGSNLTIYITLGKTVPTQSLNELLAIAKEEVHDRAALFGPTNTVARRKKYPDLTQTMHAGLRYYIEPGRSYVPGRPGLEWGEFEIVTTWLYENLRPPIHNDCTFLLFRRLSAETGQQVNLAFGAIEALDTTKAVETASIGASRR